MQALLDLPSDISPPSVGPRIVGIQGAKRGELAIVDIDGEHQVSRRIADDEHRPHHHVASRHDAVTVDQRRLALHGQPQPDVVTVGRIRPTVAIAEQPFMPDDVAIRWRLTLLHRHRRDAERHFRQDGWLEDPRRAEDGHAVAVEYEPLSQHLPW